jgi:hypothetical protein
MATGPAGDLKPRPATLCDYVRVPYVIAMNIEVEVAQTRRRAGGWGGRSLAAQGVSFRTAWLGHLEREGDGLLTSVALQGLLLALPLIDDHESGADDVDAA